MGLMKSTSSYISMLDEYFIHNNLGRRDIISDACKFKAIHFNFETDIFAYMFIVGFPLIICN